MIESGDNAERGPGPAPRPGRIVIAGGRGFIGRRLAAVLGSAGHPVVILTRQPPGPAVGPISFVRWEPLLDAEDQSWTAILEGAQAVVNLCGESIGGPRWTEKRKALLLASRETPTRVLVEAITRAANPPNAFVQASGVGYYGPGNRTVTETSGRGEDFLADLAVRWEAPLTDLPDSVRPVIARLGVVLGSSGGALGQMLMPFRMFVGGPIASGNQWLSWIHLHDAAAALAFLIDEPAIQGVFNVTAPEPVRNAEFARLAAAAIGRPGWMFTPRTLLRWLLGEQSTLLCDGQEAPPARLKKAGFGFQYETLEQALTDLC